MDRTAREVALLRILAGVEQPTAGELVTGNRVSAGFFTQFNRRLDIAGRTPLDVILSRLTEEQRSMAALARYEPARRGRVARTRPCRAGRRHGSRSSRSRWRATTCSCSTSRRNNLDIDSAEALESALDQFDGTIVAVSHDRAFLRSMTRFWLLEIGGASFEIADFATAIEAIVTSAGGVGRRAKPLSSPAPQAQTIVAGS